MYYWKVSSSERSYIRAPLQKFWGCTEKQHSAAAAGMYHAYAGRLHWTYLLHPFGKHVRKGRGQPTEEETWSGLSQGQNMQVTGSKMLFYIGKFGDQKKSVRNRKNKITEMRPFQTSAEIFVWQGYKASVPGHHSPPGFWASGLIVLREFHKEAFKLWILISICHDLQLDFQSSEISPFNTFELSAFSLMQNRL